jgi:hypothetical protein
VELTAREVARSVPFELVERFYPPVPETLQLRVAFWSFPENEEDIRLYSCLANGNVDEFQKGEHLYRSKAVKDLLQIGKRIFSHDENYAFMKDFQFRISLKRISLSDGFLVRQSSVHFRHVEDESRIEQ